MLIRQTLPLIIAYVNDRESVEGRTRFQKIIFILQQQAKFFNDRYDFVPHDYGPYSSELQTDIDDLIAKKLMEEVRHTVEEGKIKYVYQITDKGIATVQSVLDDPALEKKFEFVRIVDIATAVKNDLNRKHLPSLLADIYEKYPDYARFSVFGL